MLGLRNGDELDPCRLIEQLLMRQPEAKHAHIVTRIGQGTGMPGNARDPMQILSRDQADAERRSGVHQVIPAGSWPRAVECDGKAPAARIGHRRPARCHPPKSKRGTWAQSMFTGLGSMLTFGSFQDTHRTGSRREPLMNADAATCKMSGRPDQARPVAVCAGNRPAGGVSRHGNGATARAIAPLTRPVTRSSGLSRRRNRGRRAPDEVGRAIAAS